MFRLLMTAALGASLVAGVAPAATAQTYPTKPIRLVMPFAAGGGNDIMARLMAGKLNAQLGQPVVVESRPGAGGNIGADYVAKSPADGYMLLMAGIPHAIGMSLFKNLPYSMERDLAPITMVATFPSVIAVHPSLPARSVKELLALAKARPGELNFGASTGSPNHLAIELLNVMAKVKMVFVPYKGAGPVVIDLMAGHLHLASLGLPTVMPMIAAGKVRAIALTGAARAKSLPDVPTVQESGVNGYDVSSWYGIFAPAGTPAAIVNRLHGELAQALKAPDVMERLATLGADPSGLGTQEFGRHVREEVRKWATVVKASGAQVQ